jgi:NitT/TauT family transport system substrate-binding protein
MAGQPKAPFYVVLLLVVGGLIALALWRGGVIGGDPRADQGPAGREGKIAADGRAKGEAAPFGAAGGSQTAAQQIEQPSEESVTTVKEYTRLKPAAQRLPKPKGASKYKSLDDTGNTVNFALNVWAGWGPIIFANDGFKPGKVWKTPDGEEFKLELTLIDNPVLMRDAYVNGDVHIGWGTLDMVPLFMDGFVDEEGKPVDSRVMPRIFQQVDWSNGGDGIVVRDRIKTVADLRGERLALAQNSPSHFFALNMLVNGGLQHTDVRFDFLPDAFQAAADFQAEADVAGAVSWAPDIYKLADQKGNHMLVTTKTANKLIADIWFARADFATDHPGIIEALVRGIFDGMEALKDDGNKQHAAELMAEGYNMPASDALGMFGDAHSTNWAENYQFLLNANNPTNFEHIWNKAYYLYRQIGSISNPQVPFDQVMDDSVIRKLGDEKKYSSQKDEYRVHFTPHSAAQIRAERSEVLTKTLVIHFYPNSWDLEKKINRQIDGKEVEQLYDPNIEALLKDVEGLASQFGAAQIVIEGHSDASMKGQVPEGLVKELSRHRAEAVKEALAEKYKLDPDQFSVDGVGWDRPADPPDPNNNAKNRRVEIRVFAAEAPEA